MLNVVKEGSGLALRSIIPFSGYISVSNGAD
jgi:hypothetical protein